MFLAGRGLTDCVTMPSSPIIITSHSVSASQTVVAMLSRPAAHASLSNAQPRSTLWSPLRAAADVQNKRLLLLLLQCTNAPLDCDLSHSSLSTLPEGLF